MNALSKLRLDHWGWLNMQVALILWGIMFVTHPSPILIEGMGEWLTVITGWFTIIGGILAIIGLLNSNSFITKKSTRALVARTIVVLRAFARRTR